MFCPLNHSIICCFNQTSQDYQAHLSYSLHHILMVQPYPLKGSVTHLITCSETITLLLQIISFNFFLVDISRETTTISSLPFSHSLSYDMNPKFCCLLIWIKTLVLIIPQASVLLLHKFNTHPAVYTNPIKDWKGTSNFLPPCRYFWRMAFITNM